jgi:hypothetical protein
MIKMTHFAVYYNDDLAPVLFMDGAPHPGIATHKPIPPNNEVISLKIVNNIGGLEIYNSIPYKPDIKRIPDVSDFINLEHLTYNVLVHKHGFHNDYILELKKSRLNLCKCTKLKSITLLNVGQTLLNNLNLNKCIKLNEITIENYTSCYYNDIGLNLKNSDIGLNLKNIDFSECINLQKFTYKAQVYPEIFNEKICNTLLPNLTKNIKLIKPNIEIYKSIDITANETELNLGGWTSTRRSCVLYQGCQLPFNIEDHLELFPKSLTEFSREGFIRMHLRVKQLEEERESISTAIDTYFNYFKKENRELRKIIEELQPTTSKYM